MTILLWLQLFYHGHGRNAIDISTVLIPGSSKSLFFTVNSTDISEVHNLNECSSKVLAVLKNIEIAVTETSEIYPNFKYADLKYMVAMFKVRSMNFWAFFNWDTYLTYLFYNNEMQVTSHKSIFKAKVTHYSPKSAVPHLVIYLNVCSKFLNTFVEEETGRFQVTVLGMNTKWLGFGRKLLQFARFLETIHPEDMVVFADANDVRFLPTCSVHTIMELYKDFNTPLVFNAEDSCWPDLDIHAQFPIPEKQPDAYRYLNAGLSMGPAWAYLDILRHAISNDLIRYETDDQRFWQIYYLANQTFTGTYPNNKFSKTEFGNNKRTRYISIDWHQHLMVTMRVQPIENFEYSNFSTTGRFTYRPSGGQPCLLHQPSKKPENGTSDRLLELYSALNL
jgi:hypothetical protein